jgi:hypothetical protein
VRSHIAAHCGQTGIYRAGEIQKCQPPVPAVERQYIHELCSALRADVGAGRRNCDSPVRSRSVSDGKNRIAAVKIQFRPPFPVECPAAGSGVNRRRDEELFRPRQRIPFQPDKRRQNTVAARDGQTLQNMVRLLAVRLHYKRSQFSAYIRRSVTVDFVWVINLRFRRGFGDGGGGYAPVCQ